MTVAVIFLGLLPIMFGSGSGSNLVRSIATPMVGGMVTAPILSMLVIPVAFRLLERRRLRKRNEQHFLQQEENRS
jgi:Cu(I)/Ag(I) efflux system membrane protein CusA/SilA